MSTNWEKLTEKNFNLLIQKVPGPMQEFVRSTILNEAESFAKKNNHEEITEKDMVDAFFKLTPFGFHGPMKADMDILKINYAQYGYG